MSIEYRLEGGKGVAVLGGVRLRTVKDWLAAVDRGALRARRGTAEALLLDFRSAGYTPSAREAQALVAALVGLCGELLPPVAILTNPGVQYGGARVLCMMGELRGCQASAFQDEVEAWQWLRSALADAAPPNPDSRTTQLGA
ncbi:MAG: hypothetical protein ABSB58_12025 [Gemmatimonadales bacterium]|jgi:hypothetical protein